jgi:hypothetical protein
MCVVCCVFVYSLYEMLKYYIGFVCYDLIKFVLSCAVEFNHPGCFKLQIVT